MDPVLVLVDDGADLAQARVDRRPVLVMTPRLSQTRSTLRLSDAAADVFCYEREGLILRLSEGGEGSSPESPPKQRPAATRTSRCADVRASQRGQACL
jgi:hypothetical protein